MSLSAWLSELNRILIVFIPCILLGLLTGRLTIIFTIGLLIYGLWTATQLVTLKNWLDRGADLNNAPEYMGLADEHVSSIVALQRSNINKQNTLETLLEQFDQMVAAVPDAVIILSASGDILSSNDAAHKLLDINENEDQNIRITQLIRDPQFIDYFNSRNFAQPLELRSVAAEQHELSIRVVPFGKDNLVLVAQDMSHTARIFEMRRSFISNASHELRTPLTVILGYLESLLSSNDLPDACKSAVHSSEQQALRMKQLVEDLLTLSRLESTVAFEEETDVISISSLITDVVNEAKLSVWCDRHEFEIEAQTEALLKGALQEIHSVVSNLINNAVKHTPSNTKIIVTWRLTDENCAELVVADNGQGIEPEHIDRLTERFYRVDTGRSREKGGTGLGLSIVKHIIERHEGRLKILSELGRGTTFICEIPEKRLTFRGENC